MADKNAVGIIKNVPFEMKQVEWTIENIFEVFEGKRQYCVSPTFAFSDLDVPYNLTLWHRDDFIRLCLYCNTEGKYAVEYYFGLKKCNGMVEKLVSGFLYPDKTDSDSVLLIEKSELLQRKDEFSPINHLTIVCTLKIENTSLTQQSILSEANPSRLIRVDKLSENFRDLYADKETCDTTLKVMDKEYKAHRSVLIARSDVFAATFKHDTLERETGVVTITDCDPDSFQKFLEYVYSGKFEELDFNTALNLFYTSDKYNFPELKSFCLEYLFQHLSIETTCEIALFTEKYDQTKLFSAVQEFFNKNYVKIFLTSQWEQLLKQDYRLANKLLTDMSKMKLNEFEKNLD